MGIDDPFKTEKGRSMEEADGEECAVRRGVSLRLERTKHL